MNIIVDELFASSIYCLMYTGNKSDVLNYCIKNKMYLSLCKISINWSFSYKETKKIINTFPNFELYFFLSYHDFNGFSSNERNKLILLIIKKNNVSLGFKLRNMVSIRTILDLIPQYYHYFESMYGLCWSIEYGEFMQLDLLAILNVYNNRVSEILDFCNIKSIETIQQYGILTVKNGDVAVYIDREISSSITPLEYSKILDNYTWLDSADLMSTNYWMILKYQCPDKYKKIKAYANDYELRSYNEKRYDAHVDYDENKIMFLLKDKQFVQSIYDNMDIIKNQDLFISCLLKI